MFWNRIKQISVADAMKLIKEEGALLYDVRRPVDYEKSHATGALLADKGKIEYFVETNDKTKPIVCYCYRGVSSRIACKRLMKAGFQNVWNLKGGYAAWQKESGDVTQT
ncbi:MAG TPA: thiosulfate sulfurtransferase [Opitutae bacterium]|nr:thiosulfate sulfurtransferase [Opitutaceae bacterium]HCR31561.1 thiosulfate sulfurtransferase [Opitutae bacterium]